uniref:Helix-turn-helix transcriptional regulator n=1 Tax=Streptomyces sp. NBC_00093 TaxID=2975649 RepID=A0AAU2A0R5_9ACTN
MTARTPGLILRAQDVITASREEGSRVDPALQASVALYRAGMLCRPQRGRPDWLTPALLRVLAGLARGETVQETAERLNIAYETVRSRRKKVYAGMGARTPAHAVGLALSYGWVRDEHVITERGEAR